eukprot:gene2802-5517_t
MSYEVTKLRRPQCVSELGRECTALHHVFGADLSRKGNLAFINKNVLIYATGNSVVFEDIVLKTKRYLLALDDAGVGCVTVHPSRTMFAVGGKGFQPRIYIYSYPDLSVLKVLSGGAERGFASLAFNARGSQLASVAISPDYMLTVWDWEEERIALHSKAFGQDIYTVRFSADDDRRLTTSGAGHIRFWKMAATFTGLKLQGSIGKFGKVELSDISAFVELPDGKVLSGTETGALLLWEGNFIKCRFTQTDGRLCHQGEINYVEIDREERCVVTAAEDGFIRWWDLQIIDTAEVDSDHSMDFELIPLAEYFIGENRGGIKLLLDSGKTNNNERCYVILDTKGILSSVRFLIEENPIGIPEDAPSVHLSYSHSGAITGIDTSPLTHLAMTCGQDGTVRCWNYIERKILGIATFSTSATCLRWTPHSLDHTGLSSTIGFSDGCVRVLTFIGSNSYSEDAFALTMVFKPHRVAVVDLVFSSDGSMLATAGKDGTIFFFNCIVLNSNKIWSPIRFITLEDIDGNKGTIYCEKIVWHEDNLRVLCTCSDGLLREIHVHELRTAPLHSNELKTFEINNIPIKIIPINTTALGIPVIEVADPIDPEETPEATSTSTPAVPVKESPPIIPAKILQSVYFSRENTSASANTSANTDVLVGALGGTSSQLLECSFTQDIPLREHNIGIHSIDGKEFPKAPILSCMRYSWSGKFLVTGTMNGNIITRPVKNIEIFIKITGHNESLKGVSGVATSFDDNFILSAGFDGLLVVHRINAAHVLVSSRALYDELEFSALGFNGMKRIKNNQTTTATTEPKYLSIISANTLLEGFHDIEDVTSVPEDRKAPESIVEDIQSSTYCIEDEKLKSEEDVKMDSAEKKKQRVRSIVVALQKEYEHLVSLNHRLPKPVQLHGEAMMADGDYFSLLEKKGQDKLIEVQKECAYEAAKALELKEKLQLRLMEDILVENISLKGFRSERPILVHSLRTRGMDPALKELVDSVHASVRNDVLADARNMTKSTMNISTAGNRRMSTLGSTSPTKADENRRRSLAGNNANTNGHNSTQHGGSSAARREQRLIRKSNIQAHSHLKPREDEDDERDIKAIELAEKTMGSYKLKCADDYEVPEEYRVNADKKRRQMVLLEENMITMRLRFNERFMSMRQLKKQLIEQIDKDNHRIRTIDAELQIEDSQDIIWEPKLDPMEFPDDREEISEEELDAFKTSRKTLGLPWKDAPAPLNSICTGLKTVIKVDPETGIYFTQKGITAHDKSNMLKEIMSLEKCLPVLQYAKQSISRSKTINDDSAAGLIEARSKLERYRRLEFEKKILLKKTDDNVKSFDSALDDLRQERHIITADLKLAEIKLIVLYQEYMLLLTFEGRDNSLQQKQLRCQKEKSEIITNLTDCQNKVDLKVEDMKELNDKLKAVHAELSVLIPDSHPFSETLTKIFKKKMKRNRKGGDNDDDNEDNEEEDDDDDDDAEEEEVDDNCPLGCEVSLFDKTLDLREKRLDHEEYISETQRSIDDFKKTMDRLKQREKQIDKDSRQTEAEIKQFHLQKQAALNVIDIVVPLGISQIYSFTLSGKLSGPSDKPLSEAEEYDISKIRSELSSTEQRSLYPQMNLRSHVLFKRKALERLAQRIGELHSETENIRTDLHALYKERVRLEKDREIQQEEIARWTERINECQMLKFGRLVDLDELEKDSDKTKEEDAADQIKKIEHKHDSLEGRLLLDKEKLKDEIAEATRQNTELLKEVALLANTKLSVTRELNASTEVKSQQDSKQNVYQEAEERKKISSYVRLQAREIESLKSEITMLKRKEPPVTQIEFSSSMPLPPNSVDAMLGETTGGGGSITSKGGGGGGSISPMFPPLPLKKGNSGTGAKLDRGNGW